VAALAIFDVTSAAHAERPILAVILALVYAILFFQIQQLRLVYLKLLPKPLYHLQVVLVLAFDQLIYFDEFGYAQPLKRLLQQLQVVHELVLGACLDVDLRSE